MTTATLALAALISTTPSASRAPAVEDPQRIASVARAYVVAEAARDAADVEAQVGPVDARLRVVACEHEPEAFTPPRARMEGRTSVGVRCRSPRAWTLYIPARVRVWKQVAIATRDLQRGERVTANDVRLERRDASLLMGRYYTSIEELIGLEVSRRVAMDRALTATTVAQPKIVRRGESVTMLAGRPGLEVRVRGKALADGAIGDRIAVENVRTRRRLEGVVAAQGLVRVN